MKRILAIILIFMLIPLSGCSQDNQKEETLCSDCGESCSAYFYFCPNCGKRLASEGNNCETETDFSSIDYSDYGFENNYGFTELLWFDGYDFSDIDNAYVEAYYNGHKVLTFENGYLISRNFEKTNYFTGDFSKGDLSKTASYTIISNRLLSLYNHSTYEITNVSMKGNVPIIHTDHQQYTGNYITDGTFIPTHFIDFSRTPEKVEYNTYFGPDVRMKYFIKSEYLEGYIEE